MFYKMRYSISGLTLHKNQAQTWKCCKRWLKASEVWRHNLQCTQTFAISCEVRVWEVPHAVMYSLVHLIKLNNSLSTFNISRAAPKTVQCNEKGLYYFISWFLSFMKSDLTCHLLLHVLWHVTRFCKAWYSAHYLSTNAGFVVFSHKLN